MAVIDNDIYTPAELTGMARGELELASENSLARWLPNVETDDIVVAFRVNADGVLEEADYRAYDAEPTFGADEDEGEEIILRLPAISRQYTLSEYRQLRARNAGQGAMERAAQRAMRRAVGAVGNTANRQRATVLLTGAATSTRGLRFNDDFGRDPRLTTATPDPWTDTSVDRLSQLAVLRDLYVQVTGETLGQEIAPGATVMTRNTFSLFARGDQFQSQINDGITRPAGDAEVRQIAEAFGLPEFYTVGDIPDGVVLFLPAPGETTAEEAGPLGATYWGRTLVADEPEWGIEEDEQPGIVAAVLKETGIPPIKFVTADSISLPVALNANLSLAATVTED